MKKKNLAGLALTATLVLGSIVANGQDISITFIGTGAATQVDSVTATNLTTNESITVPGNETLILTAYSGILTDLELSDIGIVYPNPFSGTTALSISISKPQTIYVQIQNLVGQIVAQTRDFLQPGDNEFALTVDAAGIYWVSLTSEQGTNSYKVICSEATDAVNQIQYRGNGYHHPQSNELKSSQTSYTLGYQSGEIILYKCYSGIYTTIITDSPTDAKNYEVDFVDCTDLDGKTYSIVKIGTQSWMAENLAYLPSVSPSSSGSDTSPFYYVYEYEGSSVSEAKGTTNYATYGVLYNWEAAKTAYPSGWHLPTDDEWKILEKYLGMNEADANEIGQRNSGTVERKLKESGDTHWSSPNTGATNSSGFTALPGGIRGNREGFYSLGRYAMFWSSSEYGTSDAWLRRLHYGNDGVGRVTDYRGAGFSVRCLQNQDSFNYPPTAAFTYSPPCGTITTNWQFDASGCTDTETPAAQLQVRWDWINDGTWDTDYSTTKTASHQYPQAGMYTILLEVKDGGGLLDTETKQVIVIGGGGTGGDGSFTDARDGNTYDYKTIGTQTWMIENLAYLPAVSPSNSGSDTLKHYSVYGYDGTSVSAAKATCLYEMYGVLYNWSASMNGASSSNYVPSGVQGICPDGWHLPSDAEWMILEKYLGMSESDANQTTNRYSGDVGKKLKSTSGWYDNGNGDNSSGFNAFPGGLNAGNQGFLSLGIYAGFWSSTGDYSSYAEYRSLIYNSYGVDRNIGPRGTGFSVRCIKN